jgi:hypothetical protein
VREHNIIIAEKGKMVKEEKSQYFFVIREES